MPYLDFLIFQSKILAPLFYALHQLHSSYKAENRVISTGWQNTSFFWQLFFYVQFFNNLPLYLEWEARSSGYEPMKAGYVTRFTITTAFSCNPTLSNNWPSMGSYPRHKPSGTESIPIQPRFTRQFAPIREKTPTHTSYTGFFAPIRRKRSSRRAVTYPGKVLKTIQAHS